MVGERRMMDDADLTMLLLAQNTRMRIAARLTTKHKTGYQIRCECDIFSRNPIPDHVRDLLTSQGLPSQNRYTQTIHLNKLLRILKHHRHFTKEPEGFSMVEEYVGILPKLERHEDVKIVLGVLGIVV